MVDVAATPAFVVTLVGLAVMLKSLNAKLTLVELVVVPLVAVTVAVTVSATVSLQDNVEVTLVPRTTLVGFKVQDALRVVATVSATVPVKAPRDATVIVDVPAVPTFVLTLVGL